MFKYWLLGGKIFCLRNSRASVCNAVPAVDDGITEIASVPRLLRLRGRSVALCGAGPWATVACLEVGSAGVCAGSIGVVDDSAGDAGYGTCSRAWPKGERLFFASLSA